MTSFRIFAESYFRFNTLSLHSPLLKDESGRGFLHASAILDVLPSLSCSRSDDLLFDREGRTAKMAAACRRPLPDCVLRS